ncbi:unnamed protein product [Angiostrongylus costaricensis]|uniref:PHTB1_N domain-containing protein n=1 Tax=Angiostrongylus costaricensis TaxID=334426 RepID=A0A0R3PIE6_ANGCS|nr:unnamed protein product [Angiostrongylus costaricensis]
MAIEDSASVQASIICLCRYAIFCFSTGGSVRWQIRLETVGTSLMVYNAGRESTSIRFCVTTSANALLVPVDNRFIDFKAKIQEMREIEASIKDGGQVDHEKKNAFVMNCFIGELEKATIEHNAKKDAPVCPVTVSFQGIESVTNVKVRTVRRLLMFYLPRLFTKRSYLNPQSLKLRSTSAPQCKRRRDNLSSNSQVCFFDTNINNFSLLFFS